jgi:Tfp pilus assembly protein PilV
MKKGWSLVEILVAVGVIVIAFLPLINLISTNAVSTAKIGNYSKASGLLTKFMEEVKHVPFSRYQEECPALGDGNPIKIPEKFYPDTKASLEELKKDKEFWIDNSMKASKNEFGQLVEIAFTCEIKWHDKGQKDASGQEERILRDYAIIFNPETRY